MKVRSAITTADDTAPIVGIDGQRGSAFRELVEHDLAANYRLASNLLRDPSEAEDAIQDALVLAWRKWSQLRDPDHRRAWLQRIVINQCRTRLRRRRSGIREIPVRSATDLNPATTPFEEHEALAECLARLTLDQQVVLVLRFYLDLSVDEIAAQTGTRPGTVKSRLHHALRAMRAAYEAMDR